MKMEPTKWTIHTDQGDFIIEQKAPDKFTLSHSGIPFDLPYMVYPTLQAAEAAITRVTPLLGPIRELNAQLWTLEKEASHTYKEGGRMGGFHD